MIKYKCCSDVRMEDIYKAFALGFSDYVIPMTLSLEDFSARFFGPEGNKHDYSYIAYDENEPVGLILGGIRIFDHIKTMRCGTLCVGPSFRGAKVSHKLMELHMKAAESEGCRQLFLEVIKTNERAVNFYKHLGYSPVYSLKYYSAKPELLKAYPKCDYSIVESELDRASQYRSRLKDIHINWQSETESFETSSKHAFFFAKDNDKEIGYIAMSPTGKIEQLYVEPAYRNKGTATRLITAAAGKQGVEKVTICISSNSMYEGFLRKQQFAKDPIEQFEMYRPIGAII